MNSAARLINGRTLHAAFRLPRGAWTASSRTLGADKEFFLSLWRLTQLLCIDEISMTPADDFAHCEYRAQQVKNRPGQNWGGLSLLLSGDLFQLPPVAAPSVVQPGPKAGQSEDTEPGPWLKQRQIDTARGRELWRGITSCVTLEFSHRARGPLQVFLDQMRSGQISRAAWELLMDRCLTADDPRCQQPAFWSDDSCVGVLRHSARATACLHRALHLSALAQQRLVICLAVDTCRTQRLSQVPSPALLRYLCHITSLSDTENLPGVLFLWKGCVLNLEEKIADACGLVRGCHGVLESILLDDAEPSFDLSPSLPPHVLQFLPRSLLMRVPDGDFLQSFLLEQGDCLLQPVARDWTHTPLLERVMGLDDETRAQLQGDTLHITRRQLPCTNPLACTVYNLQGQTLGNMLADLSRPPGMKRAGTLVSGAFVSDICFNMFFYPIHMTQG